MLNIKNLNELKDKIQTHKVDWVEFTPKDQRRFKEHYTQDKKTLIRKIKLIEENKDKITKYEDDIAELLKRLEKIGFTFLTEEPPEIELETPVDYKEEAKQRKSRVTPVL